MERESKMKTSIEKKKNKTTHSPKNYLFALDKSSGMNSTATNLSINFFLYRTFPKYFNEKKDEEEEKKRNGRMRNEKHSPILHLIYKDD